MSDQKKERIFDIREPSTWSGLGVVILGGLFGHKAPGLFTPEFGAAVVTVIAGIVSVFKHEKKG